MIIVIIMNEPKVSVVIPAYNAEETIKQCIESVLKQTYKNIEIIVSDDGSSDNTARIAEEIGSKIVKSKNNLGAGNARNLGLKIASGEYIYFIDSDCVAEESCIENLLKGFETSESIGLVGGVCLKPPSTGNIINLAYDVAQRFKDIEKNKKIYLPYLPGSNFLIKKKVIEKVGYFNVKFLRHQDFEYTTRARKFGFKILFQPVAITHHHSQKKTLKSYLKQNYAAGIYGTIFRLKYKNFVPYSNFYPNKASISFILLPSFIVFSFLRILKNNLGNRPIKEIFITIPIIFLGQICWGIGCVKGTYKFNKMTGW